MVGGGRSTQHHSAGEHHALLLLAVLMLSTGAALATNTWDRPGCHKVGHTRKISIPGCVEFEITTNACRGFCESWSVPSAIETLRYNANQLITSVGQCCNMMDTENIMVRVLCLDGPRELTFKSAKSCSCYHCKKD
ncbi:thyrostimulin alpha-2 subunit [Ischnura elegans]|uniref:thyrostimulin alpha-2 subunit n=1 Tax=Ischnura elegans TaxID=197161 RepID=UPI001ED8AB8B|nr:thyrostimulin alpha-2 subunit [Ischnura elegans]